MKNYLKNIGIKSKKALKNLAEVGIKKRNRILENYSKSLSKNKKQIIKENTKDIKICKRQELIDRLIIDNRKIEDIRESINQIVTTRTFDCPFWNNIGVPS